MTFLRRTMSCWLAVLIVCTALAPSLRATDSVANADYNEAQAAFEKGDYRKVISLGNTIIKEGKISPALFQLLGNTRYRQGDLGRALLWYRRAALFPPPFPETRQNISHIHDRTGNLSFPGNTFGDQIVAYLTRTQWLAIAVFCAWGWLLLLVFAYVMVRRGDLRVVLVTVSLLAMFCSIVSWVCWYNRPSYEKIKDLAIVTGTDASAFTAASVTSGSVTQLPPGSEVRKIDDRGSWSYVEIPSTASRTEPLRGWVQNEALSSFWPFDPGFLE